MNQEEIARNWMKPEDFDAKNLRFGEKLGVNKKYGFERLFVDYEYSDGKVGPLCIRTSSLFTYGIKKDKFRGHYMSLLCFYDKDAHTEKETKFKEVLEEITKFLQENAPGSYKEKAKKGKSKKEGLDFSTLAILKYDEDGNNPILYPKLKEYENYDEDGKGKKEKETTIETVIRRKAISKEEGADKNNLVEVGPKHLEKYFGNSYKVVAVLFIGSIFIKGKSPSIKVKLDEVIMVRNAKPSVRSSNREKARIKNVALGSNDEEESLDADAHISDED